MLPIVALVASSSTLVPGSLRCESLVNPIGIGRNRPVLSWKMTAAQAGLKRLTQSAYRIRVASSPELLAAGKGDLWDSGKVNTNAQYGIQFGGKALKANTEAWWSIQLWDGFGIPTSWSKPAHFATGILSDGDLKGKWIGYDLPDAPDADARPFAASSWIWSKKDPEGDVPAVVRTFEKTFSLAKAPTKAILNITADDRFTLWINGEEVLKRNLETDSWRKPARLEVAKYLKGGDNIIRVEAENATPSPAGLLVGLNVAGEKPIGTDTTWTEDGEPAKIVAKYGGGPWGRFGEGKILRPSVLYRKPFGVAKGLKRATATFTALGLADLYVNGKRVSGDLFTPGWTDYNDRVYARTFDITSMLHNGDNNVGLEIGDGWYSGYVGYSRQRAHYGDRPRTRAQVILEYTDGTKKVIGTDTSWLATTGATRSQDFLAGEAFDARRLTVSRLNPIGASWGRPTEIANIKTKVEAFTGSPVRPYAYLKPVKITKQGDGWMLDYGQNLAGFAHLKAKGAPGQEVQMQFLEALNPDGTPYTANLRSAISTDSYTFRGKGVEEWEPRFTFHGYRYLKVTGLGRKPVAAEFTAVAISSSTPETGHFASSDAMLNKLAKNAWWTQKMNFIDIPTDCPQRDERLGWTGDAQAYVRTASTYSDVQPFFRKWLVSLDDDQTKDGNFPQFAPTIMGGVNGGPAWSDAGVICPWTIYNVYGDKRLLAEHYPAMKRFVEFCRNRSTKDLLPPKNFHAFGDWLSIKADTPNEVIYEAYFAYSTRLLSRAALALKMNGDAKKYDDLYHDIKAAFNKEYVSPEGVVKGDTQTGYVLALGFDLVDGAAAQKAAARLVANIESRKSHLSTGFVGTRDLMQVLSKIGRNDVAFRLLHNTTFPSWGFEIVNGATTVWERWDGWTPEKGFQDPGMNSFAHYAYGAVMGWVFANVGGIDNVTPGFGLIKLAPKLDPKLTWAKTSFDSVRGPVRTEWKKSNGKLFLTVEVPPNAIAELQIPGEAAVRKLGSGVYNFTTPLP